MGRDLKYYETGTKWAADSYLKAQNRADNSKIKDIVKDLNAMENAIKVGDTDAVKSIYSTYSADLDIIRSLAS